MKRSSAKLHRSDEERLPQFFGHWRECLRKDSFTDLKILCKDDYLAGVSMHKAVLASMSTFMASILSDGRDETTLFMPDVAKHDLLNLIKILYGQHAEAPSAELLTMLGIQQLPTLTPKIQTTTTTCIQLLDSEGDEFEAEDDEASEASDVCEIVPPSPACSVGADVDQSSATAVDDEEASPQRQKDLQAQATSKEVRISLEKLSPQLIEQLRKSTRTRPAREKWIVSGPAVTARGRRTTRRISISSSSSSSESSAASSRSSSSSSASSRSSSRSSNSSGSSRSSRSSSRSTTDGRSRESSGARIWKPGGDQGDRPHKITARTSSQESIQQSEASSAPLTLALTDDEDIEDIKLPDISDIMTENDVAEIFASPPAPPQTSSDIEKPRPETILNTPMYNPATPMSVPATPKWCPDGAVCPPGRCKATHNELTLMSTTLPRNDFCLATPFQTPPPSVTYSSHTNTPEYLEHAQDTPLESDACPMSPIQPPDLFRDEDEPPPSKRRKVLDTQDDWSDPGNQSDWSDAAWSDGGGGGGEDEVPSTSKSLDHSRFSSVFQQTRMAMTPRSREISQILDDLSTMTY